MLIISWLGMEPCVHFPFSMTKHPSDLNLCMLVWIAAVSVISCVHQFPCADFSSVYCMWEQQGDALQCLVTTTLCVAW